MNDSILRIRKALETAGIPDWTIVEGKNEGAELYFVKKQLDTRRAKDTTLYHVTVYRNEGGKTGQTQIKLLASYSDEKMIQDLRDAYTAAGFAMNPGYSLPEPVKAPVVKKEGPLYELPLAEIAGRLAKAAFSADTRKDSFLNSLEVFVNRGTVRVLTSRGTDVSWETADVHGEFVVQIREPEDVEMFFLFAYDTLAEEALAEKVGEALLFVKDRAVASNVLPSGTYDVLISGENAAEFMNYYGARSSSQMIYAKYSQWEIGKNVTGAEADPLDLMLRATAPYSAEGIPMKDRPLLEKGVLRTIHGGSRFAQYLGIEPTGAYGKMSCENEGKASFKQFCEKPVIWPVMFSSFDVDPMSGDFGGEVRLGYWFRDGFPVPVTGFSISGNLIEAQKTMETTTDRYTSKAYDGPLAFLVKNVTVAGK